MQQSITLKIPPDMSEYEWRKVQSVSTSMPGRIDDEQASWYGKEGDARYIWASVEPSGLLLCGEIEHQLWTGWLTVLCSGLTLVLNREIHDAEA